jgi:hypothetical protein
VLPSRRALASTPGDGRADCGSEPVAAAELGADKVAVFAESLAQCGNLNLQVLFRDDDARPHTPHKLVLGDQRSVGLQQDEEEIEGARPQLYRHAIGDQLPLAQQHAKTTEFKRRVSCCRARPSPSHRRIILTHPLSLVLHGLSPLEAEEQRIEANGALQAVLLNLRMKGCRLRIIPIILSFRGL